MRLNSAALWSIIALFGAASYFLYANGARHKSEADKLRQENGELVRVRDEVEELKGVRGLSNEVVRLRKDAEEVHRLRNEIRKLREENRLLSHQVQQSKQSQRLQPAPVAAVPEPVTPPPLPVVAEQPPVEDASAIRMAQMCLANMRQIEGAKEQWALEAGKTVGAVFGPEDIAPYFQSSVLPVCPAGGQYDYKTIGEATTCTTASHAFQ